MKFEGCNSVSNVSIEMVKILHQQTIHHEHGIKNNIKKTSINPQSSVSSVDSCCYHSSKININENQHSTEEWEN